MSRPPSLAQRGEAYASSPGAPPAQPTPDSSRPVTDRELEVVVALTTAELDDALPVRRQGDDLVFDLGPATYRHDMRKALRDGGPDPERTARQVAALVWGLAAIVAPE